MGSQAQKKQDRPQWGILLLWNILILGLCDTVGAINKLNGDLFVPIGLIHKCIPARAFFDCVPLFYGSRKIDGFQIEVRIKRLLTDFFEVVTKSN